MLLRFRSRDGMHRVSCELNDSLGTVLEKLVPQLDASADLNTFMINDKPGDQGAHPVGVIAGKSLEELGLKHGDIVFVNYSLKENTSQSVAVSSTTTTINPLRVKELPVDVELDEEKGLIPRKRSDLCKHGDKGMCEYCSPLPPWDKEYHETNKIKHISFHSYLQKVNSQVNKSNGSSYMSPLSQLNYKIDRHCSNGHEPWPRGICSKCQPSAITLQQQEFRMVDHVEFQDSQLVNEFIESWRFTGMQRIGYLYGTYAKYDSTPLGIKAIVEAIYEPMQHDEQDGLTMDMESIMEEMKQIDSTAKEMGLSRIGFIFTDLTDAGNGNGSVFCKRHKDSYFLTSFEIIMAAQHQLRHPNVCKYSEQGEFSSKFVTCVVSGNLDGEIDISSYQVSREAEALVDADMISGSTHPTMAWINETTNERYVPELFYMKQNEYGVTVKANAKPAFPVDYLLVSLTHGFPKLEDEESSKLQFLSVKGFPWANRQSMGQSQDYQELKKWIVNPINDGDFNKLQERLSNFHTLLYMKTLDILSPEEWQLLLKTAIVSPETTAEDRSEFLFQLVSTPGWQTLVMILQETA
ncbi:nuclear protein localization protein 4 [Monosporozyma unispora]|nr:nuclear protein localization protein 4 [Kazachstania unispora]